MAVRPFYLSGEVAVMAAEEEAAPLSGVGWAAGPESAPAGWSVV